MTEIANGFIVNLLASARHLCVQFKGFSPLPPTNTFQILLSYLGNEVSRAERQVLTACPCFAVPRTSWGSGAARV